MNILDHSAARPLLALTLAALASGVFAAPGDIVVCDQKGQTIDVYDASGSNIWSWCGATDPVISKGKKYLFSRNVSEAKVVDGGKKIAMVASGGCWAVIDRETRSAVAWGTNNGWSHSIEPVGEDVVAVVSTGGPGGNSLFLFDIAGEAATDPSRQKKSVLSFDMPHGLHYDGTNLWVVDTPGLHRCAVSRAEDGTPVATIEKTWAFAPLGVIHGHDLRPVPGTPLLVLTTQEKVLFFDMKTEAWREDLFIDKQAVKAFDPSQDRKRFLSTTAKTKWWTDTLEVWTPGKKPGEGAFKDHLTIPGAKIYKARWAE